MKTSLFPGDRASQFAVNIFGVAGALVFVAAWYVLLGTISFRAGAIPPLLTLCR